MSLIIASVGGVFGLCLGASIISIIEFIYFTMIRLFDLKIFIAQPEDSHVDIEVYTKQVFKETYQNLNYQRHRRIHFNENPYLGHFIK